MRNGVSDPISVVQAIREDDSLATREVASQVRRILASRGYGIPQEDRREIEQLAMIQIWDAVRRPGFDDARFWGFVEVVVSRRCIDWRRRRRVETRLEDTGDFTDSGLSPLAGLLERERRDLARETLAQLPETCRRLIELVVGQGRSYRQAAEVLGRSEGALRVQMYRCIGRAREVLAKTKPARKKGG